LASTNLATTAGLLASFFCIAPDLPFVLDNPVQRAIIFITGTDTGVGKTMLTCWLTRYLRATGVIVAALKPVCSGGREDAKALRAAHDGALALDEINPWHFRAPLTPLLAARREKRKLKLAQVLAHVRRMQTRFPVLLIEGAGGLLSPLGEDFDSLDLIRTLRATPIVVCRNRLGAINQVRLVLAALPREWSSRAQVVLMPAPRRDIASRTNPQLLGELIGRQRVHVLPWLKFPTRDHHALTDREIRKTFDALIGSTGLDY
jgi:dethiobiotin synthetase